MPTPVEVFNHYESSMLRIDVVTRVPDLYFIPAVSLNKRLINTGMLLTSAAFRSYFVPHFDIATAFEPDRSRWLYSHSLVDEHVGQFVPVLFTSTIIPPLKSHYYRAPLLTCILLKPTRVWLACPY